MIVTSQTIVQAPAATWTPICIQKDRRRSLMVQCPQAFTTINMAYVEINDGAQSLQILAPNPLRTGVTFIGPQQLNSNLKWLSPNPTADTFGVANFYGPNLFDTQTWTAPREMARLQWVLKGFGTPPWNADCDAFETLPGCIAIILAITTSSPLTMSKFGMTPSGFWTSESLLAGGQTWQINSEANPDIVGQEWFAWPVGTATVPIPVIESFEIDSADITTPTAGGGTISIGLPQLSPGGKKHLAELIARLGKPAE
jgi:hypothetical protein